MVLSLSEHVKSLKELFGTSAPMEQNLKISALKLRIKNKICGHQNINPLHRECLVAVPLTEDRLPHCRELRICTRGFWNSKMPPWEMLASTVLLQSCRNVTNTVPCSMACIPDEDPQRARNQPSNFWRPGVCPYRRAQGRGRFPRRPGADCRHHQYSPAPVREEWGDMKIWESQRARGRVGLILDLESVSWPQSRRWYWNWGRFKGFRGVPHPARHDPPSFL